MKAFSTKRIMFNDSCCALLLMQAFLLVQNETYFGILHLREQLSQPIIAGEQSIFSFLATLFNPGTKQNPTKLICSFYSTILQICKSLFLMQVRHSTTGPFPYQSYTYDMLTTKMSCVSDLT